ncbi:MAG: peptidyl-prolyl cis-trans isomerase [Acidobacteria bacterium]|nr:MAG: peptidyl-prolyl cis-trans isomerase [Acidobacteriota bacterium]
MGGCEDDTGSIGAPPPPDEDFTVRVNTSMGAFDIELYPEQAPITVDNFLAYVHDCFYDDLLIHRVISDFMIQGGGFTVDLEHPATRDPIPNEAANGLSNLRGTIAMARTSDPHSATSQFFINLKDNLFLDFKSETPQGWGYAVFGRVVAGMEVVDSIAAVATGSQNGMNDVPLTPVIIYSIQAPSGWRRCGAQSSVEENSLAIDRQ